MAYSKEEIASFEAKDLRISKLSIIRDLISRMDIEDIIAVNPVTELADKYVSYTYGVVGDDVVTTPKVIDWEAEANALSIAQIPNRNEAEILNQTLDKYKSTRGVELEAGKLLKTIIDTFGRYPTKQSGIEKILKLF